MKRFQFRLATLLQLRETVRHERQAELAETLRAAEAVQSELDAVRRRLAASAEEAAKPGGLRIGRLQDAGRYTAALRRRRGELDERRSALELQAAAQRDALATADRDVRALERLRDTQRLRHQLDEQRIATKELDELTARGRLKPET